MSPYHLKIPGAIVFEDFNGNVEVGSNIALDKSLSDVITGHGNYHDALVQQFTTELVVNRIGFILVTRGDGKTSLTKGVMPQTVGPIGDLGYSDTAYAKALSSTFEQLRGGLNLAVDAIEFDQARGMVRHATQSVLHLVSTVRKIRHSNPRDWGNLWLEYTYGWKPAAKSLFETYSQLVSPTYAYQRIRARATDRTQGTEFLPSFADPRIQERISWFTSKRCEIYTEWGIRPSDLSSLANYTSLNPVGIAYEVVPYSFVADWFFDFGGYMSNLENALQYASSFKRGYVTETYLNTGSWYCHGRALDDGVFPDTLIKTDASFRRSGKLRTPLNAFPAPRFPKFKVDLGLSRYTSAMALLGQGLSFWKK
jgi:hypothetical protein